MTNPTTSTPVRNTSTWFNWSTIEHNVLVLLIGAAIGGYGTYSVMNHVAADQKTAVHDALKAAATPAAVASVASTRTGRDATQRAR